MMSLVGLRTRLVGTPLRVLRRPSLILLNLGERQLQTKLATRNVHVNVVKASVAQEEQILIEQRKNRPSTPHLTIYQPQLTWILSSCHRCFGVMMAATFYGVTCSYAAGYILNLGVDASSIATLIGITFSPLLILAAKASYAYLFAFHALNGLRHLTWDAGRELTVKGVYRTGYIVMAGTVILGTYLALFA